MNGEDRQSRLEIWGDESGNLDFEKTGTEYFLVCTIRVRDPSLTSDLLGLRRQLDREGFPLPDGFHATDDKQKVRDTVFELIRGRDIVADITYYSKSNAYKHIR